MSKVIALNRMKCPVGAHALHAEFGFCEVLAAEGMRRLVRYEIHHPDAVPDTTDLPADVLPEEVLMSETIEVIEEWVDVRALREADPRRDLAGGERGRVVRLGG